MKKKLDILFVNPSAGDAFGVVQSAHKPEFNLGTGYLAAYCIQEGFSADVVDMAAEGVSTSALLAIIEKKKPAVVGISIVTLLFDISIKLAKAIKAFDDNILIVVGGPHPTALPEQTLREGLFDVVVRGEGEIICVELLKAYVENKSLADVKGLTYRQDQEIISTEAAERIDDLDILPRPYRKPETIHLYKNMVYFDDPDATLYNLISTRGCPYKCTFCGQAVVFPRKVRKRSAESVFSEMKNAHSEHGIRYFYFEDSTFVFNKKIVEELCRLLIKSNLNLKWGATGRLDLVDEIFYSLMKEAGCVFLFFGVESGNDEILKSIRKMFTIDKARKSIEIVRKVKIPFNTSFVLGLNGETKKTIRESIDFAVELDADYVSFSLATPYPGSEFYDVVSDQGWKVEKWSDYEKSRYNEPIYVPDGMTKEELLDLYNSAYKKYYLRPKYMVNHLKRITNLRQLLHHMKLGWSLFTGTKG